MPASIQPPTVSVVIPLYNHAAFIDATLDSVVAQTVPPAEIIIVDDGSQDDSWQRVRRRAATDARIITWSHPNQGAHHTINAAIQRASGEYISILNSDDCYHPQRLETCLHALVQKPGAAAVCTALTFIDGAGNSCRNRWYEQALAFYREVADLPLALINGNFLMTTSNLFIRRHVFADLGPFANLRYAHDLDFFLRLLGHQREIVWIEAPLLKYRMHGSNTINEDVLKVKIEWAAVVACFLYRFGARQDWSTLGRLAEVTDRHNLTRLLFFFFLQFRRRGENHPGPEACLQDKDFMAFMTGVVR